MIGKFAGVEPHEVFISEHEETSVTQLRKKLNGLLKHAGVADLQRAVKLMRAILR